MITVCVTTIPKRAGILGRALKSVAVQTLKPATIIVEQDFEREGAAATKNRALAKVDTPYVAFLDDDDEFEPKHLETLARSAIETDADVTYGWYRVVGGNDPRPDRFGKPFDADLLRRASYIHTAPLVKTKRLQAVGGFQQHGGLDDWGAWLAMLDDGATFVHVPERTYVWHHHKNNTSGDPTRW